MSHMAALEQAAEIYGTTSESYSAAGTGQGRGRRPAAGFPDTRATGEAIAVRSAKDGQAPCRRHHLDADRLRGQRCVRQVAVLFQNGGVLELECHKPDERSLVLIVRTDDVVVRAVSCASRQGKKSRRG